MNIKITSTLFAPEAPRLFLGTALGEVAEVDIKQKQLLWKRACFDDEGVRALSLSADGALLAISDDSGEVLLQERAGSKDLARWQESTTIIACALLDRGRVITLASDRTTKLHKLGEDGEHEVMPVNDRGGIPIEADQVVLMDKVGVLLDAFELFVWDPELGLLDVRRPVEGTRLGHPDGLLGLSSNGHYYYVYWDELIIYDVVAKALLRRARFDGAASCADLHGDGGLFALGRSNGDIIVRDAHQKTVLEYNAGSRIREVRFSADGSYLAFIEKEHGVGVLDLQEGKLLLSPEAVRELLA